jgi:hypothetical protein
MIMAERYDLARLRREIAVEQEFQPAQNRPLTQEEIKRLLAERKKAAKATPAAVDTPKP